MCDLTTLKYKFLAENIFSKINKKKKQDFRKSLKEHNENGQNALAY